MTADWATGNQHIVTLAADRAAAQPPTHADRRTP
jgi:hypothetical protein